MSIKNGYNMEEVWAEEKWTVQDLADALEYRCIEPTTENINRLLHACKGMFDDLSDRRERLDAKVSDIFRKEIESL